MRKCAVARCRVFSTLSRAPCCGPTALDEILPASRVCTRPPRDACGVEPAYDPMYVTVSTVSVGALLENTIYDINGTSSSCTHDRMLLNLTVPANNTIRICVLERRRTRMKRATHPTYSKKSILCGTPQEQALNTGLTIFPPLPNSSISCTCDCVFSHESKTE